MLSVNKYIAHRAGIIRSILSVIQSVLAAFIGVQSEDKRQQDFQKSSPWPYIITGIVMTLLLIFLLVMLVRWLTEN
ncbi:DUF2970 domain-containing protein [Oceanospirillum sanctuarii]|uniref:DUF2970 domain-containing protein n=1 Tax=Oceanospirillum sanctuarii TaxID=1434821 RepID=UPI001593923F|nr:DUF2970 domain-containing protein [Oceanospirillum sanctuarii]